MEMLLVNPRKRRKRAKGRKRASRRRSRRRSGGARRAAAGYVVGNAPIRRRKLNPRRRRRGRARRRRGFRGRRRNPISIRGFMPGNLMGQVTSALPGAVGALGLDVLLGFVPIPVTWKAGIPGYLTKIVGAVGLGMLAGYVVNSATAAKMTTGALTVMFHGILRELVATNLPQVPLGMYLRPGMSGLGYAGSGYNPMAGMGLYLPDISADPIMTDDRDLGMYMDPNIGFSQGDYNY